MTLAELHRQGKVRLLHNAGASSYIEIQARTPEELTDAVVAVVRQRGEVKDNWLGRSVKCELPTRVVRKLGIKREVKA
jgi:hypothetical protein